MRKRTGHYIGRNEAGTVSHRFSGTGDIAALAIAGVASLAAVYIVASTALGTLAVYSAAPFWDEWEFIGLYTNLAETPTLAQLWTQHNEHRVLMPHLIFLADYSWLAGQRVLPFVAILATQLLHALLFAATLIKVSVSRPVSVIAIAVAFVLLFSANQMENFAWAFQVQLVGVYFFASCACLGLAKAAELCRASEPRYAGGAVLLALIAGFSATASMANGLLIWPLLLVLALWLRMPRRFTSAVGVVGAVVLGAYLIDYNFPFRQSDAASTISRLPLILHYVTVFLGSPMRMWGTTACTLLGTLGIVALGALLFQLRHRQDPIVAGLAAIALFVVSSAFVVAAGRLELGVEFATSSRYATAAFVFWMALFCGALRLGGFAGTAPTFSARLLRISTGTIVVVIAATQIPFQLSAMEPFRLRARSIAQGTLALLVGVDDRAALGALYPDPERPVREADVLRERRLSIFAAPRAALLGLSFNAARGANAPSCAGQIAKVSPRDSGGAVVEGSVSWPPMNDPWSGIVLTDATGRVVGFADPDPPSFKSWSRAIRNRRVESKWRGYASTARGLSAYALSGDTRQACRLTAS